MRKEFEKKSNNLRKKIKFKESLEKNVGKIGEKKLKKNSMLVQNKLYVSKKVPPGERLIKIEKRLQKKFEKIEKVEKSSGKT